MNTKDAGDSFELEIYNFFREEIENDRLGIDKNKCKIYRQKGYYSKDRESEIIFDVVIECYLSDAKEYSFLILIECKNYSHAVPVKVVEQFFSKVQQVAGAANKAILASTAHFQSGACSFAKTKHIGLLRYFAEHDFKWELHRSSSLSMRSININEESYIKEALLNEVFNAAHKFYFQSQIRYTNSLWLFLRDLFSDGEGINQNVFNNDLFSRKRFSQNQVPFIDKEALEEHSFLVLDKLYYSGGQVDLDALCEIEKKNAGLQINKDVAFPITLVHDQPLGRITFDPLIIDIFTSDVDNDGRCRFTLAHELSHHLLGHGQYMSNKYCYSADFELKRYSADMGINTQRMEYQANYFASCLLMPRRYFLEEFWRLVESYDVNLRGSNALYVDDQRCNIQNYRVFLSHLSKRFSVSKEAAKIRLESMDLLLDKRKKT
jgi:Zn-dependent peptidase ImmA (M78 family)